MFTWTYPFRMKISFY